eukprot:402951-Amphidinium_carterae.1
MVRLSVVVATACCYSLRVTGVNRYTSCFGSGRRYAAVGREDTFRYKTRSKGTRCKYSSSRLRCSNCNSNWQQRAPEV